MNTSIFSYNTNGLPNIKEKFNCAPIDCFDEYHFSPNQEKYISALKSAIKFRKSLFSDGLGPLGTVCYIKNDNVIVEGIKWYSSDLKHLGRFSLSFSNGDTLLIPNVKAIYLSWTSIKSPHCLSFDGLGSRKIFQQADLNNVIFYIFKQTKFLPDASWETSSICDLYIYKGNYLIDTIKNIYPSIFKSNEPGRFIYTKANEKSSSTFSHYLYNAGQHFNLGSYRNCSAEAEYSLNKYQFLYDLYKKYSSIDFAFDKNDGYINIYFFLNGSKASYILYEFCKHASQLTLLPNVSPDDTTQNFLAKFKKDKLDDLRFVRYCFSHGESLSSYANGFAGYGVHNIAVENYYCSLIPESYPLYGNFWCLSDLSYQSHVEMLHDLYEENNLEYNPCSFPSTLPYLFISSKVQSKLLFDYLENFPIPNQALYQEAFKNAYSTLYERLLESDILKSKWTSEYNLYKIVSKLYPDTIYQYHAHWLNRQSLDMYIPSLRIAFEYQGIQHYQPVELFGGQDGYNHRVELDNKKRKLCIENHVHLIEIRYDEHVTPRKISQLIKKAIE